MLLQIHRIQGPALQFCLKRTCSKHLLQTLSAIQKTASHVNDCFCGIRRANVSVPRYNMTTIDILVLKRL
ncbi:hypothetical protein ABTE37_19440, partial [Acinetobacter baumannii]|jgi:hypothetical protein